jgi:hypothetical protein
MADRITWGDPAATVAGADLDAFFRHRDDLPTARCAPLIRSLSRLRGSDDPVVTFAALPTACVPEFADGCQVELSDGVEPRFLVTHPVSLADGPGRTAAHPGGPDQMLLTPFRAVSRTGYPSYAGVVTHWWTGRAPSESDAAIADLMVKHLIGLIDHERLMAAVARAEDRAASLALEAISGRSINLATGIVMHPVRARAIRCRGPDAAVGQDSRDGPGPDGGQRSALRCPSRFGSIPWPTRSSRP